MAERLDLSEFLMGEPDASAPVQLLSELFAPTAVQTIGGGGDYGEFMLEQGGNQGMTDMGMQSFDDAFQGGMLADPFALLQLLNVSQFAGQEANFISGGGTSRHAGDRGTMPDEYYNLGGRPQNALDYEQYMQEGELTGDWKNALLAWMYNSSYRGYDAGEHWTGRSKQGDVGGDYYDPSALRITSLPDNWQTMTMDDWNQSAGSNYGAKSLWDLASRSSETIAMENDWRNDPSIWYDPNDPKSLMTVLGEGSGLGVNTPDSLAALRSQLMVDQMGAFWDKQDALKEQQAAPYGSLAYQDFGRTGLGQYHGAIAPMMGQMTQLMGGYAPEQANYEYIMSQAQAPQDMAAMLRQYMNQSGYSF